METQNDRTPRHGTSGLQALRSAAALVALAAGTCTALAQPGTTGAPKPNPPAAADRSGEVSVDDNLTVELHVRDEDLANVLQLLSLQSQKSIIAGPNVNASVTANLYGVTFYEALDAVLHTYGYAYVEQGNMIFVMTRAEAQIIADANRLPVVKVIRLNYLSAVDAAEYVSPLLSDVGEIRTNGRSEDFSVSENNPEGKDDYAGNAMMIVFDYEDHLAEIEALVAQIDTRPEQVLVEATILQATLREDNAFGVDFSVIGDLDFSEFVGGPLNAVNNMISGASSGDGPVPTDGEGRGLSSTVGQTAQPGGLKIGIVDNDVAVFMRFLDEVTDTTVISNPKIVTLNRQQGRVQVGRRIGYLQTTTTDTSTQQSVEFLDTGTQLSFRPWITADRQIRMELRPEVSRPFLRTVTDSNGNPVTIPDEDTSELVTNVVVRDGQTIVLGGLFTETTQSGRRQWPWLGDVPILGIPFRGHNDTVERAEVIFMIKSTIMNDEVLIEQGRRGMSYVDRVRMGSREGLLPWSRERRAGQLLVDAEQLAAEGDMDGALYCVRRALSIQPMQPDAIRLRERLLSQPTVWPSRSMLGDIVGQEVDTRIRAARQEALAEFTSLVRPDNRWDNLGSIPVQSVTGVNTDGPGMDFGFPASNRFENGLNNDSFNDTAPNSSGGDDEFGPFEGLEEFNGEGFDEQDPSTIDLSGEGINGHSFRNDSGTSTSQSSVQGAPAAGNNYSWTRALSNPSGAATGASASNATASSSVTSSAPAPATAQATSSSAPTTHPTTSGPSAAATSPTSQMYPFVQAATPTAQATAGVQPDANGFYPIVGASNASTTTTAAPAANPGTGIYGRLAWIFGSKGRQMTSPAQFQQTPLVNVQESASAENP